MRGPEIDIFVGIDMAKTDLYAQVITTDGDEVIARPVLNDQAAIEQLAADAAKHGDHAAFVIDMTASGAQLLLRVTAEMGVPVAYVTGLQMRRAAELYAGSAKTDPRDAWVLADFARRNADRLLWLDVTDDLLTSLRILNGRDVDLATDANRVINRTRDAIMAVSPALERAVGPRLGQPGVRDLLAKWPTPTALNAAGRTRIRNTIKRRSPRIARTATDEIVAALNAQTLTLPAEDTWGEIIRDLVSDLQRIHTRRDELARQIEKTFLSHPLGQVLVTLCGFGPRTGARTLAEIGDPHRFANGSRLAAYAGLAPIDRRSGRSINSSSHHRGGNHRLKNAMFLASFVATQHDPHARAYYERKRAEGKRHNAAVICVARRRCDLILAMLKTATPYDPTRSQDLTKAA
ncbi:MAG TPA: IS110 family transposase [Phycisphaerales bacterium]|nr:IS110 family transposase [Phycisphaerales bacterium]